MVAGLKLIDEAPSAYEESQHVKLVAYERSATMNSEDDLRGTITDNTN